MGVGMDSRLHGCGAVGRSTPSQAVRPKSREDELRGMLLKLPLGRAYCALKIAVDADPDGLYLRSLQHLPRDTEDA